MSGLCMPRDLFVAYISEQIGFKSGLALSFDELISHTDATTELHSQLIDDGTDQVSIHFDDLLDSFQLILHRLGVLPHKIAYHAPTFFRHQSKTDPARQQLIEGIFNLLSGKNDWVLPKPGKEMSDLLSTATDRWGQQGLSLAKEIVDMMYLYRVGSLCELDRFRMVNWVNTVHLKELFSSESLDTAYGEFIDQRFIDYLEANSTSIDSMNWRKFEGLTGEFFSRSGYEIAMGTGRGDGGVDIRAWKPGSDQKSPPTILIQCKRQRSAVEQVIVKALWADVEDERAESGLVVTSSRIAPGAKKISTARGYPIDFAERSSLELWLKALRTPGSGIFMQN